MMVKNKINEIKKMNIPINMICPSHGLIWRESPEDIINKYYTWADNYKEDQITIYMIQCGMIQEKWQKLLQKE